MWGFINKTVVLRQFAKGFEENGQNINAIFKGERKGDNLVSTLSAMNFKEISDGNYYIVVSDYQKNMQYFKLSNKPKRENFSLTPPLNAENGLAVIVEFEKNNNITPVAFGTTIENSIKISDFSKFLLEKIKDKTKEEILKNNENDNILNENGNFQNDFKNLKEESFNENFVNENYDDEAVATENYYEKDEENNRNINLEKGSFETLNDISFATFKNDYNENNAKDCENSNENCTFKIGNYCENINEKENFNEDLSFQNVDFKKQCEFKKEEKEDFTCGRQNEETAGIFQSQENFYNSVKEKFDYIFEKYQSEENLAEVIENSKWVKIPYDNSNFYVVGLIYEDNQVKYIVYGVPGNYNEKPRGFENYSVFIPENIYKDNNHGYWCMFQNPLDGSLNK